MASTLLHGLKAPKIERDFAEALKQPGKMQSDRAHQPDSASWISGDAFASSRRSIIGLAFLQTCAKHYLSGSTVCLYHVSVPETSVATEPDRQNASA